MSRHHPQQQVAPDVPDPWVCDECGDDQRPYSGECVHEREHAAWEDGHAKGFAEGEQGAKAMQAQYDEWLAEQRPADAAGSERGASGAAPTDTALSGQVVLRSHAWPLRDVLTRLADAADHLLIGHDCDLHGWEEVGTARDRARELVGELAELQAKSLTKPERAPADQITLTEVVRLALEDAPCIECGGTGANNSGFACSFGCASSSEPAPADLTALFTREPQQVYAAKKLYRELVDDRSCYGGPEGMTPSDRAIITAALHFYVFGFAERAPAASSTAPTGYGVRECRGHWHVTSGDLDLPLMADPFASREAAQAAADEMTAADGSSEAPPTPQTIDVMGKLDMGEGPITLPVAPEPGTEGP